MRHWSPLVSLMLASGASAQVALTPVARLGDPAPGTGQIFEDFGAHPAIEAKFGRSGEPPATIDRAGNVAFHAFFGDDGIPNLPALEAPSAFFRRLNGAMELIIRTDAPAPQGGGVFAGPGLFPDTPVIAGGRVLLAQQVGGNVFDPDPTIWSDVSATQLRRLAGPGDNLPGMNPGAMARHLAPFGLGGAIFYFAQIANSGSVDLDPAGLWRDGQGPVAVAVTDMPVPGVPGRVFGEVSTTQRRGPVGAFTADAGGRLAIIGMTKGPGVTTSNDELVMIETAAGLEVVVAESDPVPPGAFPPGSIFRRMVDASAAGLHVNTKDEVLFTAEIDKGDGSARVPTIWAGAAGKLRLVMRGQRLFVAGNVPGDPAPGTQTTFLLPLAAALTDQGHLAFIAIVHVSNDPFNPQLAGLWADRGKGLELVAIEGGPVPGVPGAVFAGPSLPHGLLGLHAERDGSFLYTARFVDTAGRTRAGVFRLDAGGKQSLVIAEGQAAAIAGSPQLQTIEALDFVLGSGTSDAGTKVAHVTFAKGAPGIFTFPALGAGCEPDCNGDGKLNLADFGCFQTRFALGDPRADCNGDGQLNLADFGCFQTKFALGCP